jgi:hypothetical protein
MKQFHLREKPQQLQCLENPDETVSSGRSEAQGQVRQRRAAIASR